MLSFSKNLVFLSTPSGYWVRTGTDPDGNCFFNSYAYSIQPNAYRNMDISKRKQYVMKIKKYFSTKITPHDTDELIDVSFFELFLKHMSSLCEPAYKLPDLTKQPLHSISSYLDLLYTNHPSLKKNSTFQSNIQHISNQYYNTICDYVTQDGTWMFDSLIPLFMKKMEINIIIVSHETGLPITHYTLFEENSETIFMYHIHSHFESAGFYKNNIMERVFTEASFP